MHIKGTRTPDWTARIRNKRDRCVSLVSWLTLNPQGQLPQISVGGAKLGMWVWLLHSDIVFVRVTKVLSSGLGSGLWMGWKPAHHLLLPQTPSVNVLSCTYISPSPCEVLPNESSCCYRNQTPPTRPRALPPSSLACTALPSYTHIYSHPRDLMQVTGEALGWHPPKEAKLTTSFIRVKFELLLCAVINFGI